MGNELSFGPSSPSTILSHVHQKQFKVGDVRVLVEAIFEKNTPGREKNQSEIQAESQKMASIF